MRDKPYYICYSLPLRDFLIENGMKYDICGKNCRTDNPFWVYMMNEKLDKLLDQWKLGVKS